MKNTIKYIFLTIFISIFIQSCEKTVTGVNLPYEEKLVIMALLEPEIDSVFISIERTLPPLSEYQYELAQIADAEAYIECNGEKTPLIFSPSYQNINFYTAKLKVLPGNQYNLFVKWKNLSANASTIIPQLDGDSIININKYLDSTYIDRYMWENYIYNMIYDIDFFTNHNSIYRIAHYDSTSPINTYYEYTKYFVKANSNIKFKYVISLQNANSTFKEEDNLFQLIEYDYQYLKYYESRDEGDLSDNPFSTSGQNIKGNIQGNGIGYFFSLNRYEIDLKNKKLIESDKKINMGRNDLVK